MSSASNGPKIPRASTKFVFLRGQLTVMFDSCFLTTSRDMTARLYTLNPVEGFRPLTFAGHRDIILNAYISEDETTVRQPLNMLSMPCSLRLDIHCQSGWRSLHLESKTFRS